MKYEYVWQYVGGPPSRSSFVYFGAKPDKGFGLEISMWPEVGRERERSWTKELREEVGDGRREWPVDTREQRDQLAWDRVQSSEGRPVKKGCRNFARNQR